MPSEAAMGDDGKPAAKLDGIHLGDFVIRPAPATGTDNHLDTPEGRERQRQRQEDARAAQQAGVTGNGHPIADPLHPAAGPVLPAGEGGVVDDAIETSRAVRGDTPDDPTVPILLRDPLTGNVIGSV
jgi:hypothetical protein